MTIYQVQVSVVESYKVGAHIMPPDGKRTIDEDAELFSFAPSLNGARALNDREVSLLQRSRINLMQRPQKPLHSAGIHNNLMVVSQDLAHLIEEIAPGRHQIIPLSDVWFYKAKKPSPRQYSAILIMDYVHTVDLAQSDVQSHFIAHLGKTAIWLSAIFPDKRVVYTATSEGRHIWADDPTGAIFCTQEFKDRVEKMLGLNGLMFEPSREI
jgi:hypothetical protein